MVKKKQLVHSNGSAKTLIPLTPQAPKNYPMRPRSTGVPTQERAARALAGHVIPEPSNLAEFVECIESDNKFALGKQVICALVQAATVTIEVEGDAKAKLLADDLTTLWESVLPSALNAFSYGRAAFEKVYRYDRAAQLYFVDKLEYLDFKESRLRLTKEGGYDGVDVVVDGQVKDTLAVDGSWWCALNATARRPHGRSHYLLTGAPRKVFEQRRRLRGQFDTWINRFALGHGVGTAPSEYPNTPPGIGDIQEITHAGQPASPIEDMRQAVQDVQSGGCVVLASATYDNGTPMFTYTPTVTQPDASALETRWRATDDDALESIGVPPRAVSQNAEVGALAVAKAHVEVLRNTVESVLKGIIASFQKYVIDKAVALNWSQNAPCLTLVYQKIDDDTVMLVIDLVKTLLATPQPSPFVTEGVIDLVKVLEIARLPVGDNLEAKLQKVKDVIKSSMGAGLYPPLPSFGPSVPSTEPTAEPTAVPSPDAPLESEEGTEATVAAAQTDVDVAATALNGAQIASLVDIIAQASMGQLPFASVKPILQASFPTVPEEVLDKIIRLIRGFTPDAAPAPMSRKFSLQNKPDADMDWNQIADDAAVRAVALRAELAKVLSDPASIDRGRL